MHLRRCSTAGRSWVCWIPELAESLFGEDFQRRSRAGWPKLTIQYAPDFALWQRDRLRSGALDKDIQFWRERLSGAPPLLDLPTDRPRPAIQSFRGGEVVTSIASPRVARLREFGRRENATAFTVLAAAYAILPTRWSGQEEAVVGTPIAGRRSRELEQLIGMFVNTLPLRLEARRDDTLRACLARARKTILAAFEHQDVPFEKLVEVLRVQRDLSHQAVFQSMLVLHNEPNNIAVEMPDLKLSLEASANPSAQVDLALHVFENSSGMLCRFQYASDLFDPSTVERMAGHFDRILDQMIEHPDRSLRDVELTTVAERHHLLTELNRTEAQYPRDGLVHERFSRHAQCHDGDLALVLGDETMSYGELERRANRLAHHLAASNPGGNPVIALCAERSFEMVIAILAVLKAGGAYVPLDPDYPADRLEYMLRNANAPVVMTQSHLAGKLPSTDARTILLDRDLASLERYPAEPPAVAAQPQDLAYVIYTSGSTGQPKGVMTAHAALSNRLHWMQHAYRLTSSDRVLQKTPFSFDVSVWEFLWPLSEGAVLVLARPGGHKDPAYLAGEIRRQGISVVHFVPSMLQLFVDTVDVASCESLRLVVASGEALPASLAKAFIAASRAELHNLYGPTGGGDRRHQPPCRGG